MADHNSETEGQQVRTNGPGQGLITVYVNRHAFRVPQRPVTGTALKELPTPPIPPDLDLIRIMHGGEPDLFVQPDEVVELEDGAEFFAVPRTIVAGIDDSHI